MKRTLGLLALVLAAGLVGGNAALGSDTVLRNICRIKGQEENVLRGLGLVIGLAGTGEAADAVTMRSLARTMEIMGAPIPELPLAPGGGLKDIEKWKNVALVIVTARVPATGARRGDKLDCYVSAVNGKSLAGGRLAFAALQGPNTRDPRVYAMCEGAVHLENEALPLVGVIAGGCQMEEDVMTPFWEDDQITLILDENHANFGTATEVAEAIYALHSGEGDGFVRAIDASNIVVRIPDEYENDRVSFAAELLEARIYSPEPEARVVINEKTGNIVISGDVTIGDIVVSRNSIVIEAGPTTEFTALDPSQSEDAKLQALVTALNSLKVPHKDVVEIIKGIAQSGKLHGRLIIEQELLEGTMDAIPILQPTPMPLNAASPSAAERLEDARALKKAYTDFVGKTFFGQMMKAMRSTVDKPAYFHGGRAEEAFRSQLDQQLGDAMSDASAAQIAEPLFARQFPRQAALLAETERDARAALGDLTELRRR